MSEQLKPTDESIYAGLEKAGYRRIKSDGKLWSPDDMAEWINIRPTIRLPEKKEFGKDYNKYSNCDFNYVTGFNDAITACQKAVDEAMGEKL